jgi:endonuclease YncB( thermonuclease family)
MYEYGRWLARLFKQEGWQPTCLNEELIRNGLATAYDGGKRES